MFYNGKIYTVLGRILKGTGTGKVGLKCYVAFEKRFESAADTLLILFFISLLKELKGRKKFMSYNGKR